MAANQTTRFRIGQPIRVGLLSLGTLASGGALSYTAGVAAYLANPEPAVCNGTCAPKSGYLCGLDGVTYQNSYYHCCPAKLFSRRASDL